MKAAPHFLTLAALSIAFTLTGCSSLTGATSDPSAATITTAATDAHTDTSLENTHYGSDDLTWDPTDERSLVLADDGKSQSDAGVTIAGDTVTITEAGTYRVSGSLSDGELIVAEEQDALVRIIFDGVDVQSSTGSPFQGASANEIVLVLADGTQNSLSDAAEYADTSEGAPNAALWSKTDLTIAGAGELQIDGNAGDGINTSDGLVMLAGSVTVSAQDDGIRAKDYLAVAGGTLKVTAADDGLRADNDEDEGRGWLLVEDGAVTVTAGDDGIKAYNKLAITGGSVTVQESEEGLEAAHILIAGGDTRVTAADDGLNASGGESTSSATESATAASETAQQAAPEGQLPPGGSGKGELPEGGSPGGEPPTGDMPEDGSPGGEPPTGAMPGGGQGRPGGMDSDGGQTLSISGGTLTITADGDGLDSNGSAEITGGTTVVHGPTNNGNGALDVNGAFTISGGVLAAAGSSGMALAPDTDSPQPSLMATFPSPLPTGTVITVADSAGKVLTAFTTVREMNSFVYSTSALVQGDTYSFSTGGSSSTTSGLGAGDASGATEQTTAVAGESSGGFGGPGGER